MAASMATPGSGAKTYIPSTRAPAAYHLGGEAWEIAAAEEGLGHGRSAGQPEQSCRDPAEHRRQRAEDVERRLRSDTLHPFVDSRDPAGRIADAGGTREHRSGEPIAAGWVAGFAERQRHRSRDVTFGRRRSILRR
jgi:hypothetical protein